MRGSLYVSKLRGPQPFPHQNFLISHIFYNKKKDTIRALLTDTDFRKVGLLSLSHINISYLLGKANRDFLINRALAMLIMNFFQNSFGKAKNYPRAR